MASTNTTGVVEIVLFRAKPGVSDSQILEASAALQREVARFPAYVSRRLLKSEDGQWIDVVDWTSLAEAQKASQTILEQPVAQRFDALVETDSMRVLHLVPTQMYAAGATNQ